MMRATQEQVDIVALGPNSYLWLKNTAKIRILIHTPDAGESDCSPRNREIHIFWHITQAIASKTSKQSLSNLLWPH